jgi:hypothetical protein
VRGKGFACTAGVRICTVALVAVCSVITGYKGVQALFVGTPEVRGTSSTFEMSAGRLLVVVGVSLLFWGHVGCAAV